MHFAGFLPSSCGRGAEGPWEGEGAPRGLPWATLSFCSSIEVAAPPISQMSILRLREVPGFARGHNAEGKRAGTRIQTLGLQDQLLLPPSFPVQDSGVGHCARRSVPGPPTSMQPRSFLFLYILPPGQRHPCGPPLLSLLASFCFFPLLPSPLPGADLLAHRPCPL